MCYRVKVGIANRIFPKILAGDVTFDYAQGRLGTRFLRIVLQSRICCLKMWSWFLGEVRLYKSTFIFKIIKSVQNASLS